MLEQECVSVVIPVYNVEKFLPRCMESVFAQTYTNLEIILVNDGSSDSSPALCNAYAHIDKRCKVIHKKNGGLSDARNEGTIIATGDSVLFLDSDDWMHPRCVEYLVRARQENNAEIAVCDWVYQTENTEPDVVIYEQPIVYSGAQAVEKMLYQTAFTTCAWAKLYPAEFAKKYLYPVGKNCEDLFVTYKMLYESQKVAYVNLPLWAYFQREDSIMNTEYTEKNLDQLDAVNEIVAFAYLKGDTVLLNAAFCRKFSSYCQLWLRLPEKLQMEYKDKIKQGLKETAFKVAVNKNARKKNRVAAIVFCLSGLWGLNVINNLKQ